MCQRFLMCSHPVNLTQFHLSATRQVRSDVCAFWKQKKHLPQSPAGYPYVQAGHWFEPTEKNKHSLGDSGVKTSAEASQVLAFTLLHLTSVQTLWLIIAEVPVYTPTAEQGSCPFIAPSFPTVPEYTELPGSSPTATCQTQRYLACK